MKKILVPLLTLEDQAGHLIRFANQLAAKAHAEVVFLFCSPNPRLTPTALSGLLQKLRSIAKNCQSPACKCGISGARNECIVRTGSIRESVQGVLAEYEADLLLLQAPEDLAENQKAVQEEISALLNQVRIPVLVVPRQVVFHPFQTIVFAADYTDFDPQVLEKLQAWTDMFGAQTHVVQFFGRSDRKKMVQLKRAMNRVKNGVWHPKVSFHLVEEEDMLEGISDFAEQQEADLLVLATQDDYLLQHLYAKPYFKTMAYQTVVPLLRFYQQKTKPCSGSCANCSSKLKTELTLGQGLGAVNPAWPVSADLNWEI
jgi:nucleotide-binding universal stress UspA family protein